MLEVRLQEHEYLLGGILLTQSLTAWKSHPESQINHPNPIYHPSPIIPWHEHRKYR